MRTSRLKSRREALTTLTTLLLMFLAYNVWHILFILSIVYRQLVRSCPTMERFSHGNRFCRPHQMLPHFSASWQQKTSSPTFLCVYCFVFLLRRPLCRVPKWNLMIAGGLAPRSRRFPFLRITWTNLQRFTNRWETHTTDERNCDFEWREQSVVSAGFNPERYSHFGK